MSLMNEKSCDSSSTHEDEDKCDNRKCCWVCLATDGEEEAVESYSWSKPCLCRGSSKWVHQLCLQRWIDEKQHGNIQLPVFCSQCNIKYAIVYPQTGIIVYTCDCIEYFIQKFSPLAALGFILGSVYWTAVSYGGFTVIQIFGREEGIKLMDEVDPFFLLVSLPAIPVTLITIKLLNWEDYVLRFWVQHFATNSINECTDSESALRMQTLVSARSENILNDFTPTLTRVIVSAFFLPAISSRIGKYLFPEYSSFRRTILGGLSFIAIKGVLKIMYRKHLFTRKMKREILDHEADSSIDK